MQDNKNTLNISYNVVALSLTISLANQQTDVSDRNEPN